MSSHESQALRRQVCDRIIELWFPRKEVYAKSFFKSDGSMAYAPACAHDTNCVAGANCRNWVPEPITRETIYNHLSAPAHGKPQVVGSYAVAPGNISNWICFDVDYHKGDEFNCTQAIKQIAATLGKYRLPYYVEDSGVGYHIWVFCLGMETKVAYKAGRFIIQDTEKDQSRLKGMAIPAGKIEVFPKQETIDDKFGNLVKVPLGRHRNGKKCLFVDPWHDFVPLENQYTDVLLGIKTADEEQLIILAGQYKSNRSFTKLGVIPKEQDMYVGPPCTQLMYQARLSQGSRNNILFQLAINLRRSGFYELEDVKDILWKWNERNLDPLSESEFNNTVAHAFESNYSWGCNKEYIEPYCLRNQCPVGKFLDDQETNQLNAELQRMGYGNGYRIT